MGRVILVRHAMPEVVRGVANRLWRLSESSREDCVLMAHHLGLPSGGTPVYSSDEPKAEETAAVLALRLGRETVVDARFGEVDRPTTWDGDYCEMAAAYVGGEPQDGWEAHEAVRRRFTAGVSVALERANGADIIIVNHGMALTLYLATVVNIDAVAFWRALAFPDAWAVDPATGVLEHLYLGGQATG